MSTVLVTGATGFLGSALVRRLCQRGDRVRALVRPTSDRRRIADLPLAYVEGDVTDRASVERALDGVDVAYHSAALYELGTPDRARMAAINVGGTRNVLESAMARDVRAIYVSSVVALGPTGRAAETESHWTGDPPRSAYEATKREAHELARGLARSGKPVRIALPVTIYGPDDPSLVGRFHEWAARGWVRAGALRDTAMSLVHVDDCADGLVRIATRGRDGDEYILSGQPITFGAWIAALARARGQTPPKLFLPDWMLRVAAPAGGTLAPLVGLSRAVIDEGLAMSHDVHWSFDAGKARRELEWVPRPLDVGLGETLAWYRQDASTKARRKEARI